MLNKKTNKKVESFIDRFSVHIKTDTKKYTIIGSNLWTLALIMYIKGYSKWT